MDIGIFRSTYPSIRKESPKEPTGCSNQEQGGKRICTSTPDTCTPWSESLLNRSLYMTPPLPRFSKNGPGSFPHKRRDIQPTPTITPICHMIKIWLCISLKFLTDEQTSCGGHWRCAFTFIHQNSDLPKLIMNTDPSKKTDPGKEQPLSSSLSTTG